MLSVAARVLAKLPVGWLGVTHSDKVLRAVTIPNAVRLEIDAWHEMVRRTDTVHVHAEWVRRMVLANGVPESKLRFHKTGLPRPVAAVTFRPGDGPLRVSFLGRCDEVKGIDVLIRAVKGLPADVPLQVSFFGPAWAGSYGRQLLGKIEGDSRFRLPELVLPEHLSRVWEQTDILAVPSVWLETGPLVVLEAFAAGVPVLGCRVGGIPELVTDGVDGLLVPPGDPDALAVALSRLAADRELVARLRAGIRPTRTLADLADDLIPEYRRLVAHSRT
jgi:glycosyltransferase involved in cell wall biosynthesis